MFLFVTAITSLCYKSSPPKDVIVQLQSCLKADSFQFQMQRDYVLSDLLKETLWVELLSTEKGPSMAFNQWYP